MKKKHFIPDDKISVLGRAIFYIRKGWGAHCKTLDYKDFPKDLPKTPKEYKEWLESRCQGCRAKEVIQFLEKYKEY